MSDGELPLGQRLRDAREARQLTVAKAADQLHLDAWVIEALERGDYSRIGPAVYVKGHLRRYAGLLRLPEADTLAGFAAAAAMPAPDPMPTLTAQPDDSLRMPGDETPRPVTPFVVGRIIAAVLLLIGIALWWKPWHRRAPPAPPAAAESGASAATADTAGDAAALDDPATGGTAASPGTMSSATSAMSGAVAPGGAGNGATHPGNGVPATSSAPSPGAAAGGSNGARSTAASGSGNAPASGAAPAADAAVEAGRIRLRLSFSTDSWVDVHDGEGRHLYAGTARAHRVKTLAGPAPLRVHLGAVNGVQWQINGRPASIPPELVRHNAADVEVAADGTVHAVSNAEARGPRPRG